MSSLFSPGTLHTLCTLRSGSAIYTIFSRSALRALLTSCTLNTWSTLRPLRTGYPSGVLPFCTIPYKQISVNNIAVAVCISYIRQFCRRINSALNIDTRTILSRSTLCTLFTPDTLNAWRAIFSWKACRTLRALDTRSTLNSLFALRTFYLSDIVPLFSIPYKETAVDYIAITI